MTTIKAYTDIEQSKKLTNILPIESADMCYIKHASSDNPNWEFNEDFPPMILSNVPINEITAETLPCWSLAALLGVLLEYHLSSPNPLDSMYCCRVNDIETYADNPVDACYEMILRLNELNLL